MTKKILWIITSTFFIVILLLSIFAKRIHQSFLPKVQVITLDYEYFEDDGSKENQLLFDMTYGIPKELCKEEVFIISTELVNGENRTIARLATDLKLGRENAKCYEVLEGIGHDAKIISHSNKRIQDGDEVIIEE